MSDPTAALPFDIDVCGSFPPERVRVALDPSPRPTTPALDELIVIEWTRQSELARRDGRVLFNGDLLRYVRHEITPRAGGGVFELVVGPTCYRDFVGTNLYNNRRLAEFGWHTFANPVGTTATLISRDARICYGRRSGRVAYHANYVHTFGGALESRDRSADGAIDPFASLLRELDEELGLRPDEVTALRCVGLIRDREIHQPELLFEAAATLTSEEVRDRWRTASGRDEHDEIVTLADRPDAVVPFVTNCGPIAPVAVGALFLHGRLTWGDDWFRRAAAALAAPPGPADINVATNRAR